MEENEGIVAEETVDDLSEDDLSAFDEDWDDDPGSDGIENDDDQDNAVTEEEGEPDEDTEPEETEPSDSVEEKSESGNQRFKINYLGKEEELTLEEMTALAQKGRDYDHVRQERDTLKGESGRAMAFLKKLADKAGVSVEDQIDLTEAMWLMDEEAEKGNTISEAEALLRVQKQQREQPQGTEQENGEQLHPEIVRFLHVYPNAKPTDVPPEVWERTRELGGDLLGAYQEWEIKKLKEENAKSKQEETNNKNKSRSTGPLKSSGANRKKDDFDEGWDS